MSDNQESYFVITVSEDGDVRITKWDKAKLEKALTDKDWGEIEMRTDLSEKDPQYWGEERMLIIIKGHIVLPQATQVVEEYKLP